MQRRAVMAASVLDKWQDVRQVLPKLSDPEAFQSLKHGYARGGEAMQLVDNVRNYYDILVRMAPRDTPVLPAEPPVEVPDPPPREQADAIGKRLARERFWIDDDWRCLRQPKIG